MDETQRSQIKDALLKCAEENQNKTVCTGCVVISSVCKSAVERIEGLEKENVKAKEIIKSFISSPYFCEDFLEVSIKDFEQAKAFLRGEGEE